MSKSTSVTWVPVADEFIFIAAGSESLQGIMTSCYTVTTDGMMRTIVAGIDMGSRSVTLPSYAGLMMLTQARHWTGYTKGPTSITECMSSRCGVSARQFVRVPGEAKW